jgi:hypothetical protein
VSILVTAALALVDRGAMLYSSHDGASRWLLWISPLVNLTTGVPSLFQNPPHIVLGQVAIWAVSITVAAWIGMAVARPRASALTIALVGGYAMAAAGMLSVSLVWRTNRAVPLTPMAGGIELLHQLDPDRHQLALRYSPLRRVAVEGLPSAILLLANEAPATSPIDRPLLHLLTLPAATYEIEAALNGPGTGRVTGIADREFGPLWSWNLGGARGFWRQRVTLPLDVPALTIDADLTARRSIDRISIRAVAVQGGHARLTDAEPIHAVRYGPAIVFFTEGEAYTEREGTWIAGGRSAQFVIAPDPGAPIRLFVRNAPVENEVTLASGTWRQTLALRPREERMVDVPVEAGRPGSNAALLRVTTTAGFRPADLDPSNTDRRLLGCWIETR